MFQGGRVDFVGLLQFAVYEAQGGVCKDFLLQYEVGGNPNKFSERGFLNFPKGRRRGRWVAWVGSVAGVARVATLAEFLNFQNEGGIPNSQKGRRQVRSSFVEPQFERAKILFDFGPNSIIAARASQQKGWPRNRFLQRQPVLKFPPTGS